MEAVGRDVVAREEAVAPLPPKGKSTKSLKFSLKSAWRDSFSHPQGLAERGCMTPRLFVMFRFLLLLLWLSACTYSIVRWIWHDHETFRYWLAFLTHWGAMFELAYFSLAAFTSYQAVYGHRPEAVETTTPWFARATWLLQSIVPVLSGGIFLLYWCLVFEPTPEGPELVSVVMHGGNFALVLTDLILTQQPYNLRHIYAPMLVAAVYCTWTFVYHELSDSYIYEAIDWEKPRRMALLIPAILFIVLPTMHVVMWSCVRVRERVNTCMIEDDVSDDISDDVVDLEAPVEPTQTAGVALAAGAGAPGTKAECPETN